MRAACSWRRGSIARWALAALGLASCAPPDSGRVDLLAPPREGFSAVSSVLERRCGTLDCHGGPARSMRVYGVYGLRASGSDVTGGAGTTEAEINATYDAVVSVDPEVLSRVIAEAGQAPERWIVVSKGRGREHHEGGTRLPAGSAAERCVLSWISGATDAAVCAEDVFGPTPREGEVW